MTKSITRQKVWRAKTQNIIQKTKWNTKDFKLNKMGDKMKHEKLKNNLKETKWMTNNKKET